MGVGTGGMLKKQEKGAAPELLSCTACAGTGEVDAGCRADALSQKTHPFGKPGVIRHLEFKHPQPPRLQ